MPKPNGATPEGIAFVACLPSGRQCLTLDSEGAGRFTVELSQQEAAGLAAQLHHLMGVTFWVVCRPQPL